MQRDYAIDTLRTIAALMVIMIHVAVEYINPAMKSQTYDFSFWLANILDSLCRISVPLFVMISGMFLIGRNETFSESYKKRAAKKLLPLIFWTLVYIIYQVVMCFIADVVPDPDTLVKSVILGQPYYHMWYLYMLIGLYMVTPAINLIVPKISRKSLWIAAILFLVFGAAHSVYNMKLENNLIFLLWFTDYLGYFIMGYLIRDLRVRIPSFILISTYLLSALIISVLSYYTASRYGNLYFYGFLSPFVIICSLSFFTWFRRLNLRENILSRISYLTFGIYLIHAGVLTLFSFIMGAAGIQVFNNALVGIPVKFIVAFSVSLAVSWLFSRSGLLKRTI
jgi:surface polysaccharide O-acyltransferase-like enzyme